MKAKKPTIFEFIEDPPKILPQTTTTTRTFESRHQLRLLARALKRRLGAHPIHLTYERQPGPLDRARALIEEPSVFDLDQRGRNRLFVLEGFNKAWVEALRPPAKTYVLAETEDGQLQPTLYSPKRRRAALKVLTTLLEHELGIKPDRVPSLRALLKLEWSGLSRFEDYEALLRKAYLMGWSEERTGQELSGRGRINLLPATKRGEPRPIVDLINTRGYTAVYHNLLNDLGEARYHRALKQLGFDEEHIQREMGISEWRREELEEANRTLTLEELKQMYERAVRLNPLVLRHGSLGTEILLLNAPIRLHRRAQTV